MKRDDIERLISDEVEKIIAGTELELVDVEYIRERDWYLRIYLDKSGGIDLDDCQMVSEKISAFLDENDPIKENYLLEVSSPGLDRVLKKEKDFDRYQGSTVDIQLFKPMDGRKQYVGVLNGYTKDNFMILVDDEEVLFERSAVAQMRLHLDF